MLYFYFIFYNLKHSGSTVSKLFDKTNIEIKLLLPILLPILFYY